MFNIPFINVVSMRIQNKIISIGEFVTLDVMIMLLNLSNLLYIKNHVYIIEIKFWLFLCNINKMIRF